MRTVLTILALLAAGDALREAESLIGKGNFDGAVAALDKVLKAEPRNLEARYLMGFALFRQSRPDAAKAEFLEAVKAPGRAPASRYFLGRIALASGNAAEAISWLEPVAASGATVFDTSAQLASALMQTGQPRRAIPHLKAAVGQAPWDAALYFRLSQAYRKTGQAALADDALSTSNRLRAAVREDVEALLAVSAALAEGRASEAIEPARRIRRADTDPNALVALGVIYGGAGRQAEALEVFERAAALDAASFQAQFNLGLALLKTGRVEQAFSPLGKAAGILPQSADVWVTLGMAHVMTQRYQNALAPLERAAKMDAAHPQLAPLLGTAYLRTGQAGKAVPLLRAAAPSTPAPLLLLVEALEASGDAAGAVEAAETARRRFPESAAVQMAAGQQLARAGRYQAARPAFEEALRLQPGLPEAALGLADSLQRGGAHQQAVEHFRAAMLARTTSLVARAGLARSLVALRQLDEARTLLEEGVRLHPGDIPLRLELARVYARLGQPALAAEQAARVEQLKAAPQP